MTVSNHVSQFVSRLHCTLVAPGSSPATYSLIRCLTLNFMSSVCTQLQHHMHPFTGKFGYAHKISLPCKKPHYFSSCRIIGRRTGKTEMTYDATIIS